MNTRSRLKHNSNITALCAFAILNFGAAYAAQEEKELQEANMLLAQDAAQAQGAQGAPLRLAIRHRMAGTSATPANQESLFKSYEYGRAFQFKYKRKKDGTFRHLLFLKDIGKWEQKEPTVYTYESKLDPKTQRYHNFFVSIEQGEVKANPLPQSKYPYPYVVQLLPETYCVDEYCKYEKQADNTYIYFSRCRENGTWKKGSNIPCLCHRICDSDGTLIETRFDPVPNPD